MQVRVLQGPDEFLEKYISDFIIQQNIPSYFVVRLDQLKIADVRLLQKTLSSKLPKETCRLVVVSNPTIEAQNALLKTLEEIDSQTFLFFKTVSKEDLLPTIISRSQMVTFQNVFKASLQTPLKEIMNSSKADRDRKIFQFLSSFGDSINEENISDIILSLRSLMVSETEKENTLYYFSLLKALTENLVWVNSYNVQKRILLENLFLEVSERF